MKSQLLQPEDGYELWLRYALLQDKALRAAVSTQIRVLVPGNDSPPIQAATRELQRGLSSLLGTPMPIGSDPTAPGALRVGLSTSKDAQANEALQGIGEEGFAVYPSASLSSNASLSSKATASQAVGWTIAAHQDVGVLYGAFHLLRSLQTHCTVDALHQDLTARSQPRVARRVLNHWDNLDGTVERGYAGASLWDWQKLPHYVAPRYEDYARACASVGINGSVLTNVNSNALVLTEQYLEKVAALANVFRPYGIRVYLTARFSAPIELSGLPAADPTDPAVQAWWKQCVDRIYRYIPDFGGFAVKANSEGQPGPQNYDRSHAQGANLLADAVAPHGGIVMWRAFVYDHEVPDDRAKQAHTEFTALDGQFRDNVIVQVKNGPIDFQPREPHHPLFGAMPKTPLMLEFQLAQEYLGCATNLAFLGTMFQECLDTDTHARGKGSTVAAVIDGQVHAGEGQTPQQTALTGMAAVTNIGSDRNWCGHPFGASNWYTFGRLCWDHQLTAKTLAEEWIRMTFSQRGEVVSAISGMMLASREAIVDFSTPLGLHHQMAVSHHYGPGPWVDEGRSDWTSVYYHRADSKGIGFDRSLTGSAAVAQYFPAVAERYGSLETCPENMLLWFHHVPWDHVMQSGRDLWNELCHCYQRGVDAVRSLQKTWEPLSDQIDSARFAHVKGLLKVQEQEARWWRDSCVLYFQTFSQRPVPEGYEAPEKTLQQYRAIRHYYVPGIPNAFTPRTASS